MVDIKALFEAGAHFGHKTYRWHPKMRPYIYGKRGDIHIIDLEKTVDLIEEALPIIEKTVASGKQVLFVGTKPHAGEMVEKYAADTKMPWVSVRWLGGMLTNSSTMTERVKHLKKLEEKMDSGELAAKFNKLEVQRYQEEIDTMNNIFGGIKELKGKPGMVIVVDAVNDQLAIKEANTLGVPVLALVDSNADPSGVNHPVPCNDDALKAVDLVLSYLVTAVKSGAAKQKPVVKADPAKKVVKMTPKPAAATKPSASTPKPEAKKPEEAPKKEEPKPAPAPEAKPAEAPEPKQEPKAAPTADKKPDDLKDINGVGPKIEGLLNEAGIMTFKDVINASNEDLQKILDAAGPRFKMHDPETWTNKAKELDS